MKKIYYVYGNDIELHEDTEFVVGYFSTLKKAIDGGFKFANDVSGFDDEEDDKLYLHDFIDDPDNPNVVAEIWNDQETYTIWIEEIVLDKIIK